MKTLVAKYPGTCRSCQKPIVEGQMIRWYGRGQAEHASHGSISEIQKPAGPDYFDMMVEDNMRDACGL